MMLVITCSLSLWGGGLKIIEKRANLIGGFCLQKTRCMMWSEYFIIKSYGTCVRFGNKQQILERVHCTVYCVQCTRNSVHCTLYRVEGVPMKKKGLVYNTPFIGTSPLSASEEEEWCQRIRWVVLNQRQQDTTMV